MPDSPPGFAPSPQPTPPPSTAWAALPPPPTSSRMVIDLHSMVTFWGRALGFVLLFLGTLVYVAVASPSGGCISDPTSCTSFPSNAAWAILVGKVLWTIGLFFLGAGAGLKLHWKLTPSAASTPEQAAWVRTDRWINTLLVFLSVILLFILLLLPTIYSAGGLGVF